MRRLQLCLALPALALLAAPALAGQEVRLAHAIDARGDVAEGAEDTRFERGERPWLVLDLPARRTGDHDVSLCLVWRGPADEVLERSLVLLPPGEASLTAQGPPTDEWAEGVYRLEIVATGPPGEGASRACRGAVLAHREIELVGPAAARAAPPMTSGPDSLASFPWPAPKPTGRRVLERELLEGEEAPTTVGEVAERLTAALDECGYGNRSFYGVPGGFALATQIEQIEADGRPLSGPQRWSAALPARPVFDLDSFLRALFTAPEGHYRVVVFVARPGGVRLSDEPVEQGGADEWALGGVDVLPAELAERSWTELHRVTVLVYQFRTRGFDGEPEANPDGAPPVAVHLEKSGLLAALRR